MKSLRISRVTYGVRAHKMKIGENPYFVFLLFYIWAFV